MQGRYIGFIMKIEVRDFCFYLELDAYEKLADRYYIYF